MFIADFHIHSRYSRATSKECTPEHLDFWARRKGIHLVGTGDFTHPAWRRELKEKLLPDGVGFYTLKKEYRIAEASMEDAMQPRFVLTGEISSIYKKNGRVRKVHNLILLPGLEAAERLAQRLEVIGNLHSDGRPILGLDSRDLMEIALESCPEAVFIPAHIWTPHFSLFGAFSGFDTIEECFEDMTPHIHALETGLSSDPPMNWRLSALDGYTLVSNSDAHSPSKLGREANLFDTDLTYSAVSAAICRGQGFRGTIEFFPEEGKYHLDGHRKCKLCLQPGETESYGGVCPVCGGKLTVGVLHRVEQLCDRPESFRPREALPFESLIPLPEVIAASTGLGAGGVKVQARYQALLHQLGPEFYILREAPLSDIGQVSGPCVEEGIRRMREGRVNMQPGYDGEYGVLHLLDPEEIDRLSGQMTLFNGPAQRASTPAAPAAPKGRKTAAPPAAEVSHPQGDPLDGLNAAQREAVLASERAIAVTAGPGTGKTRTLAARILHLLREEGVRPSEICAVTFTNQAAGELRSRLESFCGKRTAGGLNVGTFHALCLDFLKKRLGQVTVIDEYEAGALAEETAKELHLKISSKKFLEAVSRQKNGLPEEKLPQQAFDAYTAKLREYGVFDYDDLLLKTLEWFQSEQKNRAERAFSYLLVDEFQDVSDLQYRLLTAWAKKSKRLFIIGDPDQSIYGFRGASGASFQRFEQEFGARRITLDENYRSTPEILACALPVISAGGDRRSLIARRENGPAVREVRAADDFSEAVWLCKAINRMVGGIDMLDVQTSCGPQAKPLGFSDIAVLYRTHRQAQVLEKCLGIEGIPYLVRGRDDYLADRQVRGTTGFFRWLLNPADKVSLRTALKELFSVSPALWEKLAAGDTAISPGEYPPEAEKFRMAFEKYASRVKKETPKKLLEDFMADFIPKESPALERLNCMAVFHNQMETFLQNLALGREGDLARSGSKSYLWDAVTLSTLHGAKGLEFPVVFISGVKKGVVPLAFPGGGTDLEEERRLFYVGMTRAETELILLTQPEASSFINDIPRGLLQEESAAVLRTQEVSAGKQLTFAGF